MTTRVIGLWLVLLVGGAAPAPAFAQRGGGAGGGPPLTLTFESVSGGLPVTGSGTNAATVNFGNVSAFKSLGAGVARSNSASSYTISTQFGVRVTRVGGTSPNYTLRARLLLAHPLEWQIDGVAMSTSDATVAFTQPYDSTLSHSLAFVVPLTYAAGAVTTQFQVTVIAN